MDTHEKTRSDLIELRQRLKDEINELQRRAEQKRQELNSVDTTLSLLGYRTVIGSPAVDANQLKGMTQFQALVAIAKSNEGKIRTTDAKRLLLEAGLIKNPKNANHILFSLIRKSNRFKRLRAGVYELKANSQAGERLEKQEDLLTMLQESFRGK